VTFDAGAIEATLTLKRDQFQRDTRQALADYERMKAQLEKEITIKVKAESSDTHSSRVTQQGGGLLGTDPTLLKKLEQQAAQPGGIGIIGTGTDQSLQRLLRQTLQNQLQNKGALAAIGAGQGGTDTQRALTQVVTQQVKQVQVGPTVGAPGSVTEDVSYDTSGAANAGAASGNSFGSAFKVRTFGIVAGIFKGGGGGGGGGDGGGASNAGSNSGYHFVRSFLSSTTFGKSGALGTGIAAALATLPALGGFAGVGMGVALIGGLTKHLVSASPQLKGAFTNLFGGQNAAGKKVTGSLTTTLEQAFAPMVPAITKILGQVTGLVHAILPELTGIFKVIGPQLEPIFASLELVIMNVLDLMKAAAPAFGPFITTLVGLVNNLFPGLIEIVKATVPVMKTLSQVFGGLGKDLGGFFKDMAPAVADSAQVLKVVLGAIGQLLPIIGILASSFAKILGPVIVAFTKSFQSLEPVILIVGNVLGKLAGAVIGSLAETLGLLANIIVAISPGLKVFANAFAAVFKTLENSGIFFVLENALTEILGPLGKVINQLLTGLAPVLPILIGLFAQFVAILAGQAATVLTVLLNLLLPLVPTITEITKWLAELLNGALKPLLPIIAATTIAWKLLTLALATNPFVAIGIAIALLVVIVVKYHTQIWNFIVKTWNDVKNFVEKLWGDILSFAKQYWPLLLGVGGVIYKYHEDIWKFIQQIWHDVLSFLKGLWNDLKGAASVVWSAIKQGIANDVHAIDSVVRSVWNGLKSFLGNIWGDIKSLASTLWGDLKQGFNNAVTNIKNAWDKLEGIFKAPVNFLINTVYDNGIARFWNDVMGKIGGPKLPVIKGFATGGRVPGFGGGDQHLIAVEGGETVIDKHRSRGMAPLFKALGIPGYQDGGQVPSPSNPIGRGGVLGAGNPTGSPFPNPVSSIWNGIKDIASLASAVITGNTKALGNDVLKFIHTPAVSGLATMMLGIPKTMVKQALHSLTSFVSQSGGTGLYKGKFGAGVAQWRPDVLKALAMLGLPSGLAGNVLYQMQTESGGNPNAINLTDSNAAAGDPSRGLLQTIMTTFERWRSWSLPNNIYNPMANIFAAINYAMHTYGPTLMRGGMGMGSGHGYDSGGPLPPGTRMVTNSTGAMEEVLTPTERRAFVALAKGGGGASLDAKMDKLIAAVLKSAGITGAALAKALNDVATHSATVAAHS